jgi:hypothetical protein
MYRIREIRLSIKQGPRTYGASGEVNKVNRRTMAAAAHFALLGLAAASEAGRVAPTPALTVWQNSSEAAIADPGK